MPVDVDDRSSPRVSQRVAALSQTLARLIGKPPSAAVMRPLMPEVPVRATGLSRGACGAPGCD